MKNKILRTLMALAALLAVSSCSSDIDDPDFPSHIAEWTGSAEYKSPKHQEVKDSANSIPGLENFWWNETAFYHIWIKSFYDADPTYGCGDIKGIQEKLDYIKDLGCTGIWLSPFMDCDYKSDSYSENMHGYDINDFYSVNPYFGTMEDVEKLIAACHEKDMKIIFDFVPNHTGTGNRWFKDSDSGKNEKRDWYLWNDTPLKWSSGIGYDGWTESGVNGKYYWHSFADSQPDLNFRNREVREEMKNVVRFWLNKGFDGLRVDAVRYLIENSDSAVDTEETHAWYNELREDVVKKYSTPKFMVAEAYITGDRERMTKYFGSEAKPEFDMLLDFDQGWACVESAWEWYDQVHETIHSNQKKEKSFGIFLGNHDIYHFTIKNTWNKMSNIKIAYSRPYAYLKRAENPMKMYKAATALSLLRPAVPFIYYGNEIALSGELSTWDIDCRGKMDWSSVESQKLNESSILNFNKAMLKVRKTFPKFFSEGEVETLKEDSIVFTDDNRPAYVASAFFINYGSESLLVVQNLRPQKFNSLKFSSTKVINSYSTIVGNHAPGTLSGNGSYILVNNMMHLATRVYYINKTGEPNIYNGEK